MALLFPLRGVRADGSQVWWTGASGERWVSAKRANAFVGFSFLGAHRKAAVFNARAALTGITFMVLPSDGVAECDLRFGKVAA